MESRNEDAVSPKIPISHQEATPAVKHDWYQTQSHVTVTIMVKNAKKDDVCISFEEEKLSAVVKTAPQEDKHLKFQLSLPVVPQESAFKILSTKIEIKMKKSEVIRWETLEMEEAQANMKPFTPNQYPSSSLYSRNWDKLVGDIKEEEKNEKLEEDTALSKLIQQIYSDGSDDVRRAMNKSFEESGGTVLSTDWKDVGKRKVKMRPTDDVDWKKF